MIHPRDTETRVSRLQRLMGRQLGLTSGDLAKRTRRARRDLPSGVRRDLRKVAQLHAMVGNPRIARQLDKSRLDAPADRAEAYLDSLDARDIRRGRALSVAASLALNVLLVLVLLAVVLIWRGFV